MNNTVSSEAAGWNVKRFILSGQFLPYLFFTVVGGAVLLVVGSITLNAVRNHGLLPPPTTLDRYECSGAKGAFSLYYLHGSDRVRIRSQEGVLEGTVQQNQLDWAAFAADRTMLGFAPPSEITFEDTNSLRINGTDLSNVLCTNTVRHSGHRRAIAE